MIRRGCSHFLEEKVAHNDVHETLSKIVYNLEFDLPIVTLKIWVLQDYSWVESIFKVNVHIDDFSSNK